MSKHANPTLIGAFVLGALLLGATSIILLGGGSWFQQRHQHILYFEGAAQGLQVGSPVVFLGVKIGTVKRIQLGLSEESQRFLVPVTIEVDPQTVQTSTGDQLDLQDRATFQQLLDRGLRARLRMQSLLTGQLYVDLDFYPNKPARFFSKDPKLSEIPTILTTTEELANKYENFPVEKFLKDLAAIGESLNAFLSAEAVKSFPVRLEAVLSHLESLSAKLDKNSEPLLGDIRANLAGLTKAVAAVQAALVKAEGAAGRVGNAADRIGSAADRLGNTVELVGNNMERVGSAADRVGTTADRVGEAVNANSPLVQELTRASVQVRQTAQTLQNLTSQESPTKVRLDQAMVEIARTARALRLLAESLESQPESMLRGKRTQEKR
jgi:paraquat-inducible protein B